MHLVSFHLLHVYSDLVISTLYENNLMFCCHLFSTINLVSSVNVNVLHDHLLLSAVNAVGVNMDMSLAPLVCVVYKASRGSNSESKFTRLPLSKSAIHPSIHYPCHMLHEGCRHWEKCKEKMQSKPGFHWHSVSISLFLVLDMST